MVLSLAKVTDRLAGKGRSAVAGKGCDPYIKKSQIDSPGSDIPAVGIKERLVPATVWRSSREGLCSLKSHR